MSETPDKTENPGRGTHTETLPRTDPANTVDAPRPPLPPPPPPGSYPAEPPYNDSPASAPSPPSPEPTSPPAYPPGLRRPGRDRKVGLGVAMVGLALASGVTGAIGAVALVDDDNGSPAATPTTFDQTSADDNDNSTATPTPDEPLSAAAAAVLPSVVSITTSAGDLTGEGSGVILSEDGLVLTNNHVVAAAGDDGDLSVTIADGSSHDAEVVGIDPASDLAVIRIADGANLDLTPAKLGSSSDLVVGDSVLAIGSPLGLEGSVSSGIVSALERPIVLGGEQQAPGSSSSGTAVINAIQTDAAINPGNSGGALVNTDGEVVGINTAIASLAEGMGSQGGNIGLGFAIPIDDAKAIAEQLANGEDVQHAFLGVAVADRTDGQPGAVIGEIEPGSPAESAGLEQGDLVTAVDGEPIADSTGLTATIRSHSPGDEITLTVERDGESQEITATLGELQ